MTINELGLVGVKFYQGWYHLDQRGSFKNFDNVPQGIIGDFQHVNVSRSQPHVLRGLHLQFPKYQTKLVTCVQGSIYDVVVDARPDSPTFGKHVGIDLDAHQTTALYVPRGCLHGFYVTSREVATVVYYVDELHYPLQQVSVKWSDPTLAIDWPLGSSVILSNRDRDGISFNELTQLLGGNDEGADLRGGRSRRPEPES